MKFHVVYTYDEEYQGYVVAVPELPGCFTQGKTLEEAKANAEDAIRGVLFVMEKHGEPYTPKPDAVVIDEIAV